MTIRSRFRALDTISVEGKTVLVRGDLNLPLKEGRILDETRLKNLAPTLARLSQGGARAVILSHLGRPLGKEPTLSLSQVEPLLRSFLLEESIESPLYFFPLEPQTGEKIRATPQNSIILLENTRFYPGEKTNDPSFREKLAELGDLYVNDALSCAHRKHASTYGLGFDLPAFMGVALERELEVLFQALSKPERPFAALIGGSKVSTKIGSLERIVSKVDTLILGGGLANIFLLASGKEIGLSLCEPEEIDRARKIMEQASYYNCRLVLPEDAVVSTSLDGTGIRVAKVDDVKKNEAIYDLGPASLERMSAALESHRTVLWNGSFGVFESPYFYKGSVEVAKLLTDLTWRAGVTTVAGGGDTIAALSYAQGETRYALTAGGAVLEWLAEGDLPTLAALRYSMTRRNRAPREELSVVK